MLEGYAPGYAQDALSMMNTRTASDRAAFAQQLFIPGSRVLDLGCGQGSITTTLAPNCHVIGLDIHHPLLPTASTVDYINATAYALPFATASFDVVFSHALFEHLADPAAVLAEIRRVLRPGGHLAISTSDWSRAKIRPRTANVDAALRGHYLLRRSSGGDPFSGRTIATKLATAGFTNITERSRYREDLSYRALATYVEARLAEALSKPPTKDHDQLTSAARSAWSWTRTTAIGDFHQCWQELTATR
ncbi:methyltransferase domain-containing protein [Amycolatopsis rubida]|uniref:Methyltransferase domain-containing protein n=1 Tax=Amycolatopsis rubida TaxID=112413 RepID=A0ABX0BVR2_9PSEU|nr:methyltransferase domain-containing protein [Amycolatopsis sp. M39]MYW94643.1 methyltransferase domain-containing protein [Amycolatopsis rubida]NEC59631.1 methyltransferase domain-containing protein [Amycolatopsis rubida]OAP27610.1 Demethylrebeccamycin-D-glucose O-methyltransferase [Amycolatopsis sp. M39]